ncbi:MAG: LacI family DNA-binding transcriptional regulator [Sphaerochaetaceae bacterium]|jgi:LacI family transcriptional regulator
MNGKPTLKDIARHTGCSTATVSMILAGKQLSRFSKETIEKVYTTSRELGYQPKHGIKKEGVVVIVCPSVINPYYATLLQGMETEAHANGYVTLTYNTYWSPEREKKVLDLSISPEVKGIIFAMAPLQPELVQDTAAHLPVVAVCDKQYQVQFDTVEMNNFDAGYQIGEHLIKLGHTRICYLSTTLNNQHPSRLLRYKGLVESFRKLCPGGTVSLLTKDVEPQKELETVEIEHQTGMELAQKCLSTYPEVTAMVAINDMVGYGVMDALRIEGYRIPEDYSVCGFDNIYPSQFQGIRLTTIDHQINQRGRRAFSLMQPKLEKNARESSITHVEFTNLLVERSTTGKPRSL